MPSVVMDTRPSNRLALSSSLAPGSSFPPPHREAQPALTDLFRWPLPRPPCHSRYDIPFHSILLTQADLHGSAISYRTATSFIGRASPSLTDILSNCHSYRWTAVLLAINKGYCQHFVRYLRGTFSRGSCAFARGYGQLNRRERKQTETEHLLSANFSFVKRVRLRWALVRSAVPPICTPKESC
jgi:hypothetical protein